jgi:hypothetical protein
MPEVIHYSQHLVQLIRAMLTASYVGSASPSIHLLFYLINYFDRTSLFVNVLIVPSQL